ncbi:MAG: TetR/AcrR family transcriptional regulator [Myxococcaceae bacterium]
MSRNSHSKSSPESPRKLPRQARAQATVDAILRATAHILRTKGWDALNTNAVAKVAGVSIGSLYQYFPSKEALVAALAEQHATRGLGVLMEAVTDAREGPPRALDEAVYRYIDAMVAVHEVDPDLRRALIEQVPRLKGGQDVVRRISTQSATLVRAWLETQREHFRDVDLDVATFMLVTSVEAVTHLEVIDRPKQLTRKVMVEELTQLVLRYLGWHPHRARAK